MVLQELGRKLETAMKKLSATTLVDEEVVNAMLGEISRALLEADVNIRIVGQLKASILRRIDLEDAPPGQNQRRMIQKTVMEEIANMLTPSDGGEPYQMKKGKSNVIMFVGLQGSGKTTTAGKLSMLLKRDKIVETTEILINQKIVGHA